MNKEWSELSKMMQVQINKEIERTYFLHSRTLTKAPFYGVFCFLFVF